MDDWKHWIWILGETAVSYGFYRWWKWNVEYLKVLKLAPDMNIDDLHQLSPLTTIIDYAAVHGVIQPMDTNSNSAITSEVVANCIGVIQRLIKSEEKLEKNRDQKWNKTKHTISNLIHYVPFRLVSPKGNFICIDQPLTFDSIQNELHAKNIKFDSYNTSAMKVFVDTIDGKVTTGIETAEQMLLVNTALTGLGSLKKKSDIWYLIPHERWGGILSRSSRQDIISNYRTYKYLALTLSAIFGAAAIYTIAYIIYSYYSKRKRQTNRLPTVEPTMQTNENNNTNNRLQCIICLENDIIYSLQPCSHLGLCDICAEALKRNNNAQQLCPICRAPIREYQRIFLP